MAAFNVGIIGLGSIAHAHVKACQAIPGVEVRAVATRSGDRAFADRYRISDVYADYRELLTAREIDAVIICTPNALHAPMAIAALEAGKHVLVEKPLAENGASAAAIARAAESTGRTVMLALHNRFRQDVRLAREYVAECGRLYYGRCGWFRRRGIPGWGSWFTQHELAGGGPLVDIGVHMLDLCLDFLGYPEPVSAVGATYSVFGPERRGLSTYGKPDLEHGRFDVEDLASAHIRLANGAAVNLEVSWALETLDHDWVEVMGEHGGVRLAGGKVQVFGERHGRPYDLLPVLPPQASEQCRIDQMKHFVDCCATGAEPIASVRHGVTLNRIFDAVYQSGAEGGRQVRM
jgi:predicted dehydrogenase